MSLDQLQGGKWKNWPCIQPASFFCSAKERNITLVKLNRTWEEAQDYCRSHHTDLASILSERDQYHAFWESEDAQSSHVWLGLRLSLVTGSWFWVNREPRGLGWEILW
ncbi:putative C-type lectin domain family 20 member A [Amia ocellicauda]|uniref:putative C-type lectin domain family 20 member A n=1 Tax=Amia ocellicauda TaxID=2972642 RepID=UPI00346480BA